MITIVYMPHIYIYIYIYTYIYTYIHIINTYIYIYIKYIYIYSVTIPKIISWVGIHQQSADVFASQEKRILGVGHVWLELAGHFSLVK